MAGSYPDHPAILGEEIEGEDPQRVRVVSALEGLRPMQAAWVAGDGVEDALQAGSIVMIGDQPQRGRLWRVGQRTYHDKGIAARVAAQTSQTMVEVA